MHLPILEEYSRCGENSRRTSKESVVFRLLQMQLNHERFEKVKLGAEEICCAIHFASCLLKVNNSFCNKYRISYHFGKGRLLHLPVGTFHNLEQILTGPYVLCKPDLIETMK